MYEETNVDLLPDGKRAELETAHGEVVAIEIKGKVFGFRLPRRAEVKMWRQRVSRKGADANDETEQLMLTCCVYPSPEDLVSWFDRYSMAISSSGIAFTTACGVDYSQANAVK